MIPKILEKDSPGVPGGFLVPLEQMRNPLLFRRALRSAVRAPGVIPSEHFQARWIPARVKKMRELKT